jgi:hypothetical protein
MEKFYIFQQVKRDNHITDKCAVTDNKIFQTILNNETIYWLLLPLPPSTLVSLSPSRFTILITSSVPVVALLSLKLMRAHVPLLPTPSRFPTTPHVLIFSSSSSDRRLWFWSGNSHHRNSLQAAQSKFLVGRQPGQGSQSAPRSRSEVFLLGLAPWRPTCYFYFGMYGMYYLSMLLTEMRHFMRCVLFIY